MMIVRKFMERIDDELADAKHYAEKYIECKAKGHGDAAGKYHAMAEDELKHAGWLHEMAAAEVGELDRVFRPTEDMRRAWEECSARYADRAAWVKQMLAM